MRHRRKLIVAALLLAATYATIYFWPHSNPQAVRALTEFRELIDLKLVVSTPTVNPLEETQVEISIVIGKIDITDATTGLWRKSADKPVASAMKRKCAISWTNYAPWAFSTYSAGRRSGPWRGSEAVRRSADKFHCPSQQ